MDDEAVWELMDVYEQLQDGDADPEDLEDVDWELINSRVQEVVTEVIQPHLVEIRQEAQANKMNGQTRRNARQQLEAMPKEQQTEQWNKAVSNLVRTAALLHTDPLQAMSRLKEYSRNPWFTERLLLVLSDPEYVDPDHAEDMKELVTDSMRWFFLYLTPEIYTEGEKRDLLDRLFPDKDPDELLNPNQQGQAQQPQPSGPGGTAQWHGQRGGGQGQFSPDGG